MKNQIEYAFKTEPDAYRFLNTVVNWALPDLSVKFGQSSFHVRIDYEVKQSGFDDTLSKLDDLAERERGIEV